MKDDMKETFILMLGHLPNISAVARLLNISPATVYAEKRNDPKFDSDVKEAMEVGYDGLEEEAIRRGRDGVLEPIFSQGIKIGSVRKYSDTLLKELLRAYRPQKFNPSARVVLDSTDKVTLTINIGEK